MAVAALCRARGPAHRGAPGGIGGGDRRSLHEASGPFAEAWTAPGHSAARRLSAATRPPVALARGPRRPRRTHPRHPRGAGGSGGCGAPGRTPHRGGPLSAVEPAARARRGAAGGVSRGRPPGGGRHRFRGERRGARPVRGGAGRPCAGRAHRRSRRLGARHPRGGAGARPGGRGREPRAGALGRLAVVGDPGGRRAGGGAGGGAGQRARATCWKPCSPGGRCTGGKGCPRPPLLGPAPAVTIPATDSIGNRACAASP